MFKKFFSDWGEQIQQDMIKVGYVQNLLSWSMLRIIPGSAWGGGGGLVLEEWTGVGLTQGKSLHLYYLSDHQCLSYYTF